MPVILGGNTGIYLASLTPSVDPDAQAFITAAAITDPTQQAAINQLVIGLKADGLWTKMKAVYPFVGGTSSTHKWNLKNPLDTNAAFRLQFNGGWTHSSTGALPNGTNAFADTYLSPNLQQSLTSGHFGLYSRTSAASTTINGASGIRDGSGIGVQLYLRRQNNGRLIAMWGEGTNDFVLAANETDAKGLYLGSRTANNSLKYYKNASIIAQTSLNQTTNTLSSNTYYLSALNLSGFGMVGTYDNKEIAFASIGDGLTDTEAANFYTAIQAFQVALGRQIP
jgi:hypothetical protein